MTDFTCSNFKELMFDYIDGELNEEEVDKFENHIKNCGGDCGEEFREIEKMMSSVRDSRYVIDGELYAALVPKIEAESKKIKMDNMLRNIRRYGSVGIAAIVMIVILVYFAPLSDIVNDDSTLSDSMEIAGAAEDVQIAPNSQETVIYTELEIAVAVPRAYTIPAEEAAEPSEMLEYLNNYAPDYINDTETLYISYNEVNVPDDVIVDEVIAQSECSVYVISKLSNDTFDIDEVTEYTTVYDTSENGKTYLVIIAFNSNET